MIRAGMTVAEAILQLTKGFRKIMGRDPDGLEKIKIQQEAVKKIEEVNKVVDMEGNVIDTSKGIMGGKQIQDSPEFGARIRETYDKAKGPGKGQEMVDALKSPGARKSYKIIEDQLGVKLYGDETFDEILEIQKTGKHPRGEPKADGGRIGYKDGMDRRTFMKIMGGLATLPFVGKFVKGAKLAAPAVKKVADITAPALDKIIDTVMSAGKLVSQSGRRLKELTTKKRLKDIEVEEDMMDGPSYTIKTKDKTIYYKPGKQDEMGIEDDIIEVIEDTVTKKAGGGIARMLGE